MKHFLQDALLELRRRRSDHHLEPALYGVPGLLAPAVSDMAKLRDEGLTIKSLQALCALSALPSTAQALVDAEYVLSGQESDDGRSCIL
jgi:hypothetical protein